jgi:RecA-family ATPase
MRSRLYFERIMVDRMEPDPNLRVLTNKKANYAALGTQIRVRWQDGVFSPENSGGSVDKIAAMKLAEQVFLDILLLLESQGREVSSKPSASYAPTVFAAHPDAKGITKKVFALAMERLFQDKRIRLVDCGTKSRPRKKLATV